jgi:hypothetical protein
MKEPRVSVLMSVYNEERYVGQAIDSILGQTFTDLELIVVDDGSTDASPAIFADYALRDRRVVVLKNDTNHGLVPSLNRGLAAARGEYISRMDGDDVSLPERLARQVLYMDRHPEVGVLGANIAYIDAEGGLLDGGRPKDAGPLSAGVIRWMLLWRCAIYHPTVMIRHSVLKSTGFTYDSQFRHAEDRDLWTRLASHTRIASLPEVLVHYRVLPTSVCRVHRREQRSKDQAITRRELTMLLGAVSSVEAAETLISVFTRHNPGPHRDFVGAADLLLQAYRRFCEQSLSWTDRRRIEEDVAQRLLVIGREAALQSPGATLQVLWTLRRLSPRALLSISVVRGVTGVCLRAIGLGVPETPCASPSAVGGNRE